MSATIPQQQAAAAVRAALFALVPEALRNEPTEPANHALSDLHSIASDPEAWTEENAAWAIECAVENSSLYTEDGFEHSACREAAGEEGDPIDDRDELR